MGSVVPSCVLSMCSWGWNEIVQLLLFVRPRPYHVGNTGSRLITSPDGRISCALLCFRRFSSCLRHFSSDFIVSGFIRRVSPRTTSAAICNYVGFIVRRGSSKNPFLCFFPVRKIAFSQISRVSIILSRLIVYHTCNLFIPPICAIFRSPNRLLHVYFSLFSHFSHFLP